MVLRRATQNRWSLARLVKLSSPLNVGGVSRSHEVRLMPRVARMGPADSTARPMSVGARNSHAHLRSLDSGPPPRFRGARPAVLCVTTGDRPTSLGLFGQDPVQRRHDALDGLASRLDGVIEDVHVELPLKGLGPL